MFIQIPLFLPGLQRLAEVSPLTETHHYPQLRLSRVEPEDILNFNYPLKAVYLYTHLSQVFLLSFLFYVTRKHVKRHSNKT